MTGTLICHVYMVKGNHLHKDNLDGTIITVKANK